MHTTAPWFVSGNDANGQPLVSAEDTSLIAVVTHECAKPRPELAANARLIAAAPELLSLLARWRALDAGAWHAQRHQREKDDLERETDDLISALKRIPTDG